jgi:tetratricopeptide (TPR) repeat protein
MARGMLSCLEKRDLLNRAAVSVNSLLEWGEFYEQSGLIFDAVDFYEKAKAVEPLNRLLKEAEAEGNAFLFNRVSRALGHEPSREEWLSLAKNAESQGKFAFAAEAYTKAGESEPAQRCSSLVWSE